MDQRKRIDRFFKERYNETVLDNASIMYTCSYITVFMLCAMLLLQALWIVSLKYGFITVNSFNILLFFATISIPLFRRREYIYFVESKIVIIQSRYLYYFFYNRHDIHWSEIESAEFIQGVKGAGVNAIQVYLHLSNAKEVEFIYCYRSKKDDKVFERELIAMLRKHEIKLKFCGSFS